MSKNEQIHNFLTILESVGKSYKLESWSIKGKEYSFEVAYNRMSKIIGMDATQEAHAIACEMSKNHPHQAAFRQAILDAIERNPSASLRWFFECGIDAVFKAVIAQD